MASRPNVEQSVIAAILQVAAHRPRPLGAITREQTLIAELGLDSMDVAELVAILEAELGCDPFAETASIADVHTVGDLIEAYARQLG